MNKKRIEEILNNDSLGGDGAKVAAIRKAIGMAPRFKDIPDGTPAVIRTGFGEVLAEKSGQYWLHFDANKLGRSMSCAFAPIVHLLIPDPGDVNQQIEHEVERLTAKWQAKYEKQRKHSAQLESALRNRTDRIASLEAERSRLHEQVVRMEAQL